MNLVVIFGIKIYQKLPRSLTVWSPTSLVLKETCLSSHHHHHQRDPSPQIKKPCFLGSTMMGRDLKAAHCHIRSPSYDNIPDDGGLPPCR